jgi:hypothetical protein
MGSPAIFAGSRTKFLTAGGIELPNRTTAQRDALTPVQGQTIYNSTTGAVEYFDGAVWKKLLESSSKINYFSDFLAKNLNKFIIYNNSSGATPTDGVGGTPNITKSLNTSTPIIETSSYRMSKDAVNRQGQGFSITTDIPLDAPVTAGEPITVQFRYRTSANYTTGDVRMFVYFVGPNTLQALNGVSNTGEFGNNLVKSFDNRSQFTASTSCPAGTTAIRVIGHIATTSTSAYDIDIDEITIGTASTLTAPIVTDWVPYTPTLTNFGNATSALRWRRVGDSIQISGRITIGSSLPTGVLSCTLPSGFTYDTSKQGNYIGKCSAAAGSAVHVGSIYLTTPDKFEFYGDDGSSLWNASTPITFAAGNVIDLMLTAAVTQFAQGSNVISSTQANFFRGALRASRTGSANLNPNNNAVKIPYNTVTGSFSYQMGGLIFDTTNNRFVASRRILIKLSASLGTAGANVLNNLYYLQAVVNGSSVRAVGAAVYPLAGIPFIATVSAPILLNAGDFLEVFLFGNGNNSSNQISIDTAEGFTYFSVTEIPDLSVVGISGAPLEILHTTSSQKTPAGTNQWHAHTGNSLTLTPGVWRLSARGGFFNNGSLAGYTVARVQIGSSNGGDSGTEPPLSGSNFQILDGSAPTNIAMIIPLPGGVEDIISHTPQKIVSVVSTQTFFANSLAVMATPANSRIIVSLTAERIR